MKMMIEDTVYPDRPETQKLEFFGGSNIYVQSEAVNIIFGLECGGHVVMQGIDNLGSEFKVSMNHKKML
jgi:hypothetical protein